MPRYNLQRGSNILFLFFLSSQFNISSTYFFTPHKTRLLTRGWHFFLTTTSYEYANRSFRATSWKQRNVSVVFLSFFFFFCLSLTIRKLFTYGPPPRYCDGMEGPIVEEASSSMPYLFPPISLLLMFTVYSRKLLTFRGAAQKWNWWKANKKVDWHGSRKWNLFIYLYVCVYSGPRSASFEQMTSASFVVVDIVERERRREETKGLSALNFTFHSWLAFLFFHHSDGLY